MNLSNKLFTIKCTDCIPNYWQECKHCTSWYCQHLINVHGCKATQILCAQCSKEVKAFDETLECRNCNEVWCGECGDEEFDEDNTLCTKCYYEKQI
jgi:hypothetical protein